MPLKFFLPFLRNLLSYFRSPLFPNSCPAPIPTKSCFTRSLYCCHIPCKVHFDLCMRVSAASCPVSGPVFSYRLRQSRYVTSFRKFPLHTSACGDLSFLYLQCSLCTLHALMQIFSYTIIGVCLVTLCMLPSLVSTDAVLSFAYPLPTLGTPNTHLEQNTQHLVVDWPFWWFFCHLGSISFAFPFLLIGFLL